MPHIQLKWHSEHDNLFLADQLNFDIDQETLSAQHCQASLNPEQCKAFDVIWQSVTDQKDRSFFLDDAGGTGKTFLYSTLCHSVCVENWIVLCVASCAIAALLLPGGHTAHSTFTIPVHNLTEDSSCQIDKNNSYASMLQQVQLIIWNEAITQHRCAFHSFLLTHSKTFCIRHTIEAVNQTLQGICNSSSHFGGITTVFRGDFQQTLSVVPHGSRKDIVHASIQSSRIWNDIQVLCLH